MGADHRHLAAHAIAQVDILCEVFGLWMHANGPYASEAFQASGFRTEMGKRFWLIAIVRDAHDSHKHGQLRNPKRSFTKGQRTQVVDKTALGFDASRLADIPLGVEIVILTANDGATWWVFNLLQTVVMFWEGELERLDL